MEANSEKIPMMASTCELRGIDFQTSALGRLSGELCVCFKIVFLFSSATAQSYFPAFRFWWWKCTVRGKPAAIVVHRGECASTL